jgi:hypothetical protein
LDMIDAYDFELRPTKYNNLLIIFEQAYKAL